MVVITYKHDPIFYVNAVKSQKLQQLIGVRSNCIGFEKN